MSKSTKAKPVTVPFAAKHAGEAQGQFAFGDENTRWSWTESTVWTDRMLTALENGVKGGKWFSLIDHQRWPNAFFAELGLFSLERAHLSVCQSTQW